MTELPSSSLNHLGEPTNAGVPRSSIPRLRLFFPSAAWLLTDHRPHGEGLIAWNLLSRLAQRGHEVVACAREVDLVNPPPFVVHETGRASPLESIEPLKYARKARQAFAEHGGDAYFDVVHWLFPPGDDEILYHSAGSTPYVIGPQQVSWPDGVRETGLGTAVRLALRPVFRMLRRRAWNSASGVLLSLPAARGSIPSFCRARSYLLPFGIDVAAFQPQALPATPTIAYVGRLVQEKGIHDLVDAFAKVREALPATRLLIAGDGPLRSLVEQLLPLAPDAVELLGPVAHDQVDRILSRASVLCMPSHGEPYGMAILEAMAAGRPAVAYDWGGPAFLIHHGRGGVLVPPQCGSAGLAAGLVDLLSHEPRLAEMGSYNRLRAEEAFAWEAVVSALEDVYVSVLGR